MGELQVYIYDSTRSFLSTCHSISFCLNLSSILTVTTVRTLILRVMAGTAIKSSDPTECISTIGELSPGDSKEFVATVEELPPSEPAVKDEVWQPRRRFHQWKSPLLMLIFFVIGLNMGFAHCTFYASRSGHIVGSSSDQERVIRRAACLSLRRELLSH
jgi:hypothetical protein